MSELTASEQTHGGVLCYRWPLALCLFTCACAAMLFSYRDALQALSVLWWDSVEYGHGVLVPPVMAYAIWLDRQRLAALSPSLCPAGLYAVAAAALMWLLSRKLGVLVGEQTAMMLMLPALSWLFLGPGVTRTLAFVFLFPFAASPLWYLINPLLQDATAWATTALVRELGIPMYREGNYLTIAYGRFHVAQMCSGLRYLLAGLSLAAVFSFLNIRTVRHAAVMLLAGFLAALVSNWIRVSVVVVLGHVSEMQHPMIEDHLVFGWVVFALSMVPLMMFGYWLARRADALMEHGQPPAEAAAASPGRPGAGPVAVCLLLSAALIAAGPILDRPLDEGAVEQASKRFDEQLAAFRVPGWQRVDQVDDDWAPRLPGAHRQRVSDFEHGGQRVSLYLGMLAGQRQGAEVVNDANQPFNRSRFRFAPGNVMGRVGRTEDGFTARESWIRHHELLPGSGDRLVWTTYRVVGEYQHHRLRVKLLQTKELWGATPVAFEVAVSTGLAASLEQARERIKSFLGTAQPALHALLQSIETSP